MKTIVQKTFNEVLRYGKKKQVGLKTDTNCFRDSGNYEYDRKP